ncbi:MAG: hypothetical protein M0Z58_08490 [Nitrospiraceae bacterium]|nr:hypothetical protein [Nitrospiraceae bacterium]
MPRITRALLSVSDKSGIVEFARGLAGMGVELVSTGGTRKTLTEAGLKVIEVGQYTGFPEMLEGRVKTLHPKIHGGLLARRGDPRHMQEIKEHGIGPIDMVVVNLYPFEKTVANPDVKFMHAIENIDIGGPTMLRAGAKNFESVAVICDPADYGAVLAEMKSGDGQLSGKTRFTLARKVFAHTARYDSVIADYLDGFSGEQDPSGEGGPEGAAKK